MNLGQRKKQAKAFSQKIFDDYYKGVALAEIIDICVEANQIDEAKELFSEINEEFIREQLIKDHPALVDGSS